MSEDLTTRPRQHRNPLDSGSVDDDPVVGEWYWYTALQDEEDGAEEKDEPLGTAKFLCVTEVGSNYVILEGPEANRYGCATVIRVHIDEFWSTCKLEPDAVRVIDRNVAKHQDQVRRLMGDVERLTALLGMSERKALGPGEETQAIALRTSGPVEEYKTALQTAKQKTLPELFKQIEQEHEMMAVWMKSSLIPLKAQTKGMKGLIHKIDDRILTVELYAGLCEQVTKVRDGEPAPNDTPITLLQRRHYMDEECLLDYEHGGMSFKNIEDFDRWMAKPSNSERLLPFQRCVVAFRVRHHDREMPDEIVSITDLISFWYEQQADKKTYLYMRNGEQLFRLSTGIEFDEKLFPDLDKMALDKPLYAKVSSPALGGIEDVITEGDYLVRKQENEEARRKYDADPEKWPHKSMFFDEPHRRLDRYERFEPMSMYYDDMCRFIAAEMARHNRVATVLQGLLDRSPVFHPHPPWRIWTPDGFAAGVRLCFDSDRALTSGDPPDFKAFQQKLNKRLKVGSVVVGAEAAWERVEAVKENRRRERQGHYDRYSRNLTRFRPGDDPGPGEVARIAKLTRTGQATFTWLYTRWSYRDHCEVTSRRNFTVHVDALLNADAYEAGDYKQFFADPRTRADYLKWAGFLLVAEDYKAGKRMPRGEGPPTDVGE